MVLRPEVYVKLKSFLHERIESIIKPHIIYEIEEVLKTKLTKEISDLEQEHRVLSQDYNKQLGVIKDIDKELKKPKDEDEKKSLEVRKSVADKEKDKILDQLNKIERLQNKYDDRLRELTKSAPSASSSSPAMTGMGIIRKKSKAKAKGKAKAKSKAPPPQPINQPIPNTGLQPQLYKQQLTTPTTITPQLTQQVAQPVAQQVAATLPTTAPATTGAGKFRKPRAKAKSKKLKPIKDEEEEITVIKPPKMTLDYIDLNNDPYLINRIR
jgi:hypothetical protein